MNSKMLQLKKIINATITNIEIGKYSSKEIRKNT